MTDVNEKWQPMWNICKLLSPMHIAFKCMKRWIKLLHSVMRPFISCVILTIESQKKKKTNMASFGAMMECMFNIFLSMNNLEFGLGPATETKIIILPRYLFVRAFIFLFHFEVDWRAAAANCSFFLGLVCNFIYFSENISDIHTQRTRSCRNHYI